MDILDLSELLKHFKTTNILLHKINDFFFKKVKNIVVKGENTGDQHFLFFLHSL